MTTRCEQTYRIAIAALFVLLTDLWIGIVLTKVGLYPGAMAIAEIIAGFLFVVIGVCGLLLVVFDDVDTERQSELQEWETAEN